MHSSDPVLFAKEPFEQFLHSNEPVVLILKLKINKKNRNFIFFLLNACTVKEEYEPSAYVLNIKK